MFYLKSHAPQLLFNARVALTSPPANGPVEVPQPAAAKARRTNFRGRGVVAARFSFAICLLNAVTPFFLCVHYYCYPNQATSSISPPPPKAKALKPKPTGKKKGKYVLGKESKRRIVRKGGSLVAFTSNSVDVTSTLHHPMRQDLEIVGQAEGADRGGGCIIAAPPTAIAQGKGGQHKAVVEKAGKEATVEAPGQGLAAVGESV